MKYGASVAYSYVNEYTDHFGMRSEVMEFDFRPNTPAGIKKVTDILQKNHPKFQNICLVNLIPLANDPIPKDIEDDLE